MLGHRWTALAGAACLIIAAGCASSSGSGGSEGSPTGPASRMGSLADVAPATTGEPRRRGRPAVVDHVVDGDTLVLAGGQHVRLVQVDTPEVRGTVECYGTQASATAKRWLPAGTRVRVEQDPLLDHVDHYGRVLGYVWKGSVNVNIRLVQVGAASVWFYGGARGRFASALDHAVRAARRSRRGLWRACPGTELDTSHGVETGRPSRRGGGTTGSSGWYGAGRVVGHSHGLPVLAPPPPDVDCGQLPGPVWVGSRDPHRLDRGGDGIGCNR